jgi:polyisoprenoid-binding protein YceI
MLLFAALLAGIATYDLGPAPGASVTLKVDKTGLMSGKQHVFVFDRYKGTLAYDAEAPERSRVELAIASASLVCKDTWVSEKDRKKIERVALDDMLASGDHHEITFRSTSIAKTGPASFDVTGTLGIRGIEKPATVAVTVEAAGTTLTVAGKATVRLKDYGMKPPSAALGTIGTKNEMLVEFVLRPR